MRPSSVFELATVPFQLEAKKYSMDWDQILCISKRYFTDAKFRVKNIPMQENVLISEEPAKNELETFVITNFDYS